MKHVIMFIISMAWLGLGAVLFLANGVEEARAQASPARPSEQDWLARQVEELRLSGKLEEAVQIAEQALSRERRGGEMRAEVAEAAELLAGLCELQGDWVRVPGLRNQAAAVRESVDGKDHWRTTDARGAAAFASKMNQLGEADRARVTTALLKEQQAARLASQGKPAEADRLALEAIAIHREVAGPETAELAHIWHRLGRARRDAKASKEANEQALAIRRKVLPANHPDLGRSLNNLALAEGGLKNPRRAEELLEEAVRVWRASPGGPSDPLVVMGLVNLGSVQRDLGKADAARKSYEEALAIQAKNPTKDNAATAQILGELGDFHYDLKDFSAAKKSYEEALALLRMSANPINPGVARGLFNLGNTQSNLGELAAARRSLEEAVAIGRKVLPKDSANLAQILLNLANVQLNLKDHAAAKTSLADSLAIFRKALPRNHPRITFLLEELGGIRETLREFGPADANYREALEIRRKALPEGCQEMVERLVVLGNMNYLQMGAYDKARATFEEALVLGRQDLPKGDPLLVGILTGLGNALDDLGEYAAARERHAEALAIVRNAMPHEDANLIATLNNLALVEHHLRDSEAARRHLEEAMALLKKVPDKYHVLR
jgi:tetratricopeptide (TPR) repeat protein